VSDPVQPPELHIQLTKDEILFIVNRLAKFPFEEVVMIISKLDSQVTAQTVIRMPERPITGAHAKPT
jgi:hypothetical protein